jgi:hypothetical protein
MNVMNALNIGLSLGVWATTIVLSLPAQADEIILAPAPGLFVSPTTTTTTTRTVEVAPEASTVLVSPADTIERHEVFVGERPAATSSSSTYTSSNLGNRPSYGERLRLLRQQLDKGIANNWIPAGQIEPLKNRLAALDNQECSVRSAGYLKVDCDSFEKDLTGYNIDLSHSMESHN